MPTTHWPLLRVLQIFQRLLWQRHLPHGLVSWRYLWPRGDAQIIAHRQLWWRSHTRGPRALWCAMELVLWLRWVLWHGPRSTWVVVKHLPSDSRVSDTSMGVRYWRALKLTLGWCIAPHEWRLFGLDQHPERALSYVYLQETGAYHALRNQARGVQAQSLRCLQDKTALAKRLAACGVPMVPDLQCVPAHSAIPWAKAVAGQTQVFCKMRSGNQGQGAFAAWQTSSGWQGQRFTGRPLPDTPAVETAWQQLLTLDDALVQPLLQNHPDLAHLAHDGRETITLRLITDWQQNQPRPLWPLLEVPIGRTLQGRTHYGFLAIDVYGGVIQHQVGGATSNTLQMPQFEALLAQLPQARTVPYWEAVIQASLTAHQHFSDVQSIAWDWVITSNGPILLEGNSGWGLAVPQSMAQGFIHWITCNDKATA